MQTQIEISPYKLTFGETQLLKTFHELVKIKAPSEKITALLSDQKVVESIIKLAELNVTVENWCQKKEMCSYWNALWERLGCYPTWIEAAQDPNLIYRPLRPQVTISSFNLVRGKYFYDIAKQFEAANDKTLLVYSLKKAAKYHNFMALQALTNLHIKELTEESSKESLDFFKILKKSIPVHGTPVYILCAFLCYAFAQIHEENNRKNHADAAYQNMLIYLYAAEYAQSAFEDAIHNAYYGLGIARSNQWMTSNFSVLREKLLENSSVEDENTALQLAKNEGKKLADSLINIQCNVIASPQRSYSSIN